MDKRQASRWSCESKFAFADAATARKVAKRMSQNHTESVGHYRCVACAAWHVGNCRGRPRGPKPPRFRPGAGAP